MSKSKNTKKKVQKKSKGFTMAFLLIPVLLIVVVSALIIINHNTSSNPALGANPKGTSASATKGSEAGSANTKKSVVNADLVIPIKDISEKASFYPVSINGTKMEVLAVKAPDGTIRTAFNTCEVCYSSGRGYYKQSGNQLVCQNCGNAFTMSQVGLAGRGGCNPYAILDDEKTVDGNAITISKEFLNESKEIFANWKI